MTNALMKKPGSTNGKANSQTHSPSPLQRLNTEINKLFEDFAAGFSWQPFNRQEPFSECRADVDICDVGNNLIITAEIPGVEMDDLNIAATAHYVSISGEKKHEKAEEHRGYYRMERDFGCFRRVLHLPCEIQKDKVDAVFKNGVLTLTLPKTAEALANEHPVTVKAG